MFIYYRVVCFSLSVFPSWLQREPKYSTYVYTILFSHTQKTKFMMKLTLVSYVDGVFVEMYVIGGAQTHCLFSIYERYCQIYLCFPIILLLYLYVLYISFTSSFQLRCIHFILEQKTNKDVPNVVQMQKMTSVHWLHPMCSNALLFTCILRKLKPNGSRI